MSQPLTTSLPLTWSTGAAATEACLHCGLPVPAGETKFCCPGCSAVYAVLHDEGLEGYYGQNARVRKPALLPRPKDFTYLDDPAFRKLYAPGGDGMDFYLEGAGCAACVWLVEKVPQHVPGIASASLNLGRSVAHVKLEPGGSFAPAAAALERYGYRPHAVRSHEAHELILRENRTSLVRIGVAAACTLNLMLFAIALYAGMVGVWERVFLGLSLMIYLPVALYAAAPFYRSAWGAARAGKMAIDIPIVLGLALGTAAGVRNLFVPGYHEQIYFDSLSMLVFLLLGSRYLVRRVQQKALDGANLIRQMTPPLAWVWSAPAACFEAVPADRLRAGDRVEVRPGDVFPADGIVMRGESEVSSAVLTGESRPLSIQPGDSVLAGAANLTGAVEVEITAVGAESRLGRILKMVDEAAARRTPASAYADRIAGRFTLAVLAAGAATFGYWLQRAGLNPAVNHTVALFVVTCPCALAMSAPVAMLVTLGRLAKHGVVVKGPETLERLAVSHRVYLDKTGTLTEGKLRVASWQFSVGGADEREILAAVRAIEAHSRHPVALALTSDITARGVPAFPAPVEVREIFGRGVSGLIHNVMFEVRRAEDRWLPRENDGQTEVEVLRAGHIVARVLLADTLRADAAPAVQGLRAMGCEPVILSGDGVPAVQAVARVLGIADARAACSPEEKLAVAEMDTRCVLVGDGANDAAALAAASVGIAVHGGMEASLQAADVYMTRPGVSQVVVLIRAARETMGIIRRNLAFTAIYNLAGAILAVTGVMSPLAAAILMPLSSFTILTSSALGARSLR